MLKMVQKMLILLHLENVVVVLNIHLVHENVHTVEHHYKEVKIYSLTIAVAGVSSAKLKLHYTSIYYIPVEFGTRKTGITFYRNVQ